MASASIVRWSSRFRTWLGMVTVPARPYVVIPAALRSRCGLRAGDHVLLAASPGEDKLTAYSFAVVDQALRAHCLWAR